LKDLAGIEGLTTDVASRSCSFQIKKEFDIKGTLAKLATTNTHIKGYELVQ